MTIRMQEAEAARDFSKVMDLVRAGNEVVLEHDGKRIAYVSDPSSRRPRPSHIDDIERGLAASELENGPAVVDPEWETDMQEIRAIFNTPKEVPWD